MNKGSNSVLSDRESLEQLVVDNPDLERLERLLDQFNIFEAIGAVRQELRHSDFLGFLLNPQQNHGLGDAFLKNLLQRVLLANRDMDLPISLIDLDVLSLEETVILREWRSIDILVLNEHNKLAVIIENKIGGAEHSDQLERYYGIINANYPDYRMLALYLTPDGTPPSGSKYLPVSYGQVAAFIEDTLRRRSSSLGDDVRTILAHYAQMLRRHIVSDSEIKRLCEQIYRKHQSALDLIFEHRPDVQTEMKNALERLICETPDLILDKSSKSYISFTSSQLDAYTPKSGTGWSLEGRMLLFHFVNNPGQLRLMLEIGPGPSETRQRFFEIAQRHKPPFTVAKTKSTDTYTRIWSHPLVSYEAGNVEAALNALKKRWADFIEHDLPHLTEIIVRELNNNGH